MAVFCISVIKRRKFLDIIENISEVDNKIGYTHQEETYMKRNEIFNIISDFIVLNVFPCTFIIYFIYQLICEGYYIIYLTLINISVNNVCNISS